MMCRLRCFFSSRCLSVFFCPQGSMGRALVNFLICHINFKPLFLALEAKGGYNWQKNMARRRKKSYYRSSLDNKIKGKLTWKKII